MQVHERLAAASSQTQRFQTVSFDLFGVASIAKVENDRVVGAETQAWLHRCWLANKNVIDRFIADNHLSKELLELPYCHMQFERVTGRIAHYRQFAGDYVAYYANRLKRRLAPMIPSTAKNVFRHAPR